jgi:hypothetical protein
VNSREGNEWLYSLDTPVAHNTFLAMAVIDNKRLVAAIGYIYKKWVNMTELSPVSQHVWQSCLPYRNAYHNADYYILNICDDL